MSANNPEYDFKWCPGCGDFGVRRALEAAVQRRVIEIEEPVENTVVVAGIGCSGNMVHLLEKDEPYGFHGFHGFHRIPRQSTRIWGGSGVDLGVDPRIPWWLLVAPRLQQLPRTPQDSRRIWSGSGVDLGVDPRGSSRILRAC